MAAAVEARSRRHSVLLLDENRAPGGQIWRGGPGAWQDKRAERLWASLRGKAAWV